MLRRRERVLAIEEVQRVVDALRALQEVNLDEVEDDAALALLLTKALDEWPQGHSQLREMRQQVVRRMHDSGKTWAEIAAAMELKHHSRAQQIARGATGPQGSKARARRAAAMREEPDAEPPASEE
jgi:hypothetical protein